MSILYLSGKKGIGNKIFLRRLKTTRVERGEMDEEADVIR